jgi:hypothetical protein
MATTEFTWVKMMQRLVEKYTVPPDGYRFFQAETRTTVSAPDYDNLFVEVAKHRKVNNIPMGPLWEAQVEDQLCQQLPPGFCKEEDPLQNRRNVFTRIAWEDVLSGTQTIASWATGGFKSVDQLLANSRADTCSRCPFNVQIGGLCAACTHLQNLAAKFTGGRRTTAEPFLKACAVCHCSLAVKVWVPIEAIRKGTSADRLSKFPEWCWIPKEIATLNK